MRHWRLFEDLLDMQADANRFFDDVYRRLAMFEIAMNRWDALDSLDAQNTHQALQNLASRSVFTERTERRVVVEGGGRAPSVESHHRRQTAIEPAPNQQALPTSPQRAAVDVIEQPNSVTIRADLPGLQPGDIQLSVSQNTLRFSGKVDYSIPLPEGVNQSQIRAAYRNGLLEVTLPKPTPGRSIEVVFEEPEPPY